MICYILLYKLFHIYLKMPTQTCIHQSSLSLSDAWQSEHTHHREASNSIHQHWYAPYLQSQHKHNTAVSTFTTQTQQIHWYAPYLCMHGNRLNPIDLQEQQLAEVNLQFFTVHCI